jgi:UTP--glucose-1-phosphate uridylyltransferase
LNDDGHLSPTFDDAPPVVALDPRHYRQLPEMEARFPHGPPSLRMARSLAVRGDVSFGAGVTIRGDVVLDGPAHVPDGEVLVG